MRGDGNGGIVINSSIIKLITVIIPLLLLLTSVIAYSIGVNTQVDQISDQVTDLKKISDLSTVERNQNTKDLAVSNGKYEEIIRRLDRIDQKLDSMEKR